MDVFLATTRTLRIQGHIVSGFTGALIPLPAISLRRVGADDAVAIDAAASLNLDRKGWFELTGVTPGSYYVIAEADENGTHLVGRKLITAGEESIPSLELLAVPPQKWRGRVKFSGDPQEMKALSAVTVALESRDETAPSLSAQAREDGTFEIEFIPEEIYDVYVRHPPREPILPRREREKRIFWQTESQRFLAFRRNPWSSFSAIPAGVSLAWS